MPDETHSAETPSKDEIVCPLSLKLGVVQNYRCSYRPQLGVWESRPVVGTDKYAEKFYDVLHNQLNMKGANALKFKHEDGAKARKEAIQLVNEGKIRAPRRNWDEKFGPQGGRPLDELKEEFPELYATTTTRRRTRKQAEDEAEVVSASDLSGISDPLETDDLEDLAEIEGEGAHVPETEESYAVEATKDLPSSKELEDITIEPDSEEAEKRANSTATSELRDHHITVKTPSRVVEVKGKAFKFTDNDGDERIMFRIAHPVTKMEVWVEEGQTELDGVNFLLETK